MKEQDKVEEFTNVSRRHDGRFVSAHQPDPRAQPDLNFAITALPATDDYTGKRGLPYARGDWHLRHQRTPLYRSVVLVQFLMSAETNSKLSSIANAFPGNVNSTPDFATTDELFGAALQSSRKAIWPMSSLGRLQQLMREFDEQFQLYLITVNPDDALNNAQAAGWSIFSKIGKSEQRSRE
ncbi:MAG: hypothetical protein R2932_59995 [Caldilineaceae bacterium]